MEKITSRDNPAVRLCRKVASGSRERKKEGLLFAEGLRLCLEAKRAGLRVPLLLAEESAWQRHEEELAPLAAQAGRVCLLYPSVSAHIAQTENGQGIYCLCQIPEVTEPDWDQGGRFLLLDHLQDPGNLGTIVRCAEAFGVTAVVLSPGCPDPVSPKVLRSTLGSVYSCPPLCCGDLPELIGTLRRKGMGVYAAALDASAVTPGGMERPSAGLAVVIGNEGNGVSPQVLEACGGKVYIPMKGETESLNAAVAATVLMWEISGKE